MSNTRGPRGPRGPRARLLVPLLLVSGLVLPSAVLASATPATAQDRTHGSTTRVTPGPDRSSRPVTRGQALALLHRAQARLEPRTPRSGRVSGRGPATEVTTTLVQLFHARSALTGADRRAADALLARPTDGGGTDAATYGDATDHAYCGSADSHFCIHYVTTGVNRVSPTDADHDGTPDYVQTVAATMDTVWNAEIDRLGYRAPLSDEATVGTEPGNPDGRVDVYLAQLGPQGLYGYCAPEGASDDRQVPGYCVLDNDYSLREYATSNPLLPMRVTAAHEFFHDVQFGYDVAEDTWFMEGTATWIEDEVFDSVNDNYQYLADSPIRFPSRAVDYSVGLHPYGAWIFFRYAAESLGGPDVVRSFWDAADAATGSQYSLQAIVSTVSQRHSWSDFFARFATWNLLPPGTYSERAGYPAPAYRSTRTLTTRSPSTGTVRTDLVHLSSASVRVSPASTLPVGRHLRVTIDAPDRSRQPAALLLVRATDGTARTVPLTLDAAGKVTTVLGFDRRKVRSVTVTVADTSPTMRSCGTVAASDGGPLYSCFGRGTTDPTSANRNTYAVTARAF
ncbi:MXAN_6640 family putative metalloprotease [Nocardioides korecus]